MLPPEGSRGTAGDAQELLANCIKEHPSGKGSGELGWLEGWLIQGAPTVDVQIQPGGRGRSDQEPWEREVDGAHGFQEDSVWDQCGSPNLYVEHKWRIGVGAGAGPMCDLLWSDPQPQNGRSVSKRGVSCQFGPDVTKAFLEENQLDYIIRSHEVKAEGYEVAHGGRCVTVFSAPNYCDQMGNKASYIHLRGSDLRPQFHQFTAVVSHPSSLCPSPDLERG
ncbi:Hypothetical predicted protein [Marmota monax]|uniref:Serine/threonine specific protein phosphatases domain-containing protein n=1 Tax=Marmota monax TaxID=9995 RepID=A0A5E4BMV4_MARMO|nr:Hypothetical predicted protein [Marmota monax]